jgi:hypothetical protein
VSGPSRFLALRFVRYETGHSLTVEFTTGETRKFAWKPALNQFGGVEEMLRETFGPMMVRE